MHKILIVDDDAFIRRPLELMLRQEGFSPRTAADGNECLERLAEDRPDLILLDVMMPGRDGYDLCKSIKSTTEYAHIPIIMLSARGQQNDKARGLCLGAADFMTKPYVASELLQRIRELLSSN